MVAPVVIAAAKLGGKAAFDQAIKFSGPAEKITVVNASKQVIRVECTAHSENLQPGETMHKDWAYAVFGGTPDVSVWVNRDTNTKNTVEQGQTVVWYNGALRFKSKILLIPRLLRGGPLCRFDQPPQ